MWSNGSLQSQALNLNAGNYMVTISDNLGCQIDTGFNLIELDQLDISLNFQDSIICDGQEVTVQVSGVGGISYNWTGPNNFGSTDSVIQVSQSGQYIVRASASICATQDTVQIMQSEDVLQAQFIIPTQIVVGDTLIALETSWPAPSNVIWSYDTDSIEFIRQDQNQWWFEFPFIGEFPMTMNADLSSCNSSLTKIVTVYPDSSGLMFPQLSGANQILSFVVSPNPSVGFFEVDFELAQDLPYTLSVYQLDGLKIEDRIGSGNGALTESFNLGSPANGIYVVTLSSGSDRLWRILSVERP